MSQLDQYVNASADDYTTGNPASSTANELNIQSNQVVFPVQESQGYAFIDTSSIPDDATIDSATFYWYDHAYTAPKGAGVDSYIQIWDLSSQYTTIFTFTSFTAGAKSHALTSGELAYVNKTGDTKFRFITSAPNAGKSRNWYVRAWDGYSGSNQQCRLVVNYTEASSRKKTMVLR